MDFRTELNISAAPFEVDYRSEFFAVGSCFAANVAERLRRAKFAVTANPFGEMFNPLSAAECVERLSAGGEFTPDDFRSVGDVWFSWSLHSSFDSNSVTEAVAKANAALRSGAIALDKADTVIITLGTAWIYELAEQGRVVANCHKQPSGLFRRRRLSVAECTAVLKRLFDGVLKDKRIILTVSPVRHLGDGLTENSLSKATLRVSAAEVESACSNVWYFPAFELLTDDLRDYRFYADDMVHPSPQAVDYVWEKFCLATMNPETRRAVARFEKLSAAAAHRPLRPDSSEFGKFRQAMLREAQALGKEFPTVDLSAETELFSK